MSIFLFGILGSFVGLPGSSFVAGFASSAVINDESAHIVGECGSYGVSSGVSLSSSDLTGLGNSALSAGAARTASAASTAGAEALEVQPTTCHLVPTT